MSKFIPGTGRLLVKVIEQDKILDGIILPDSSKDDMLAGVVLSVGPEVTQWQTEDRILFGPWAGMQVQIEGVPLRVLKDGEVIGKLC